MAELQELVFHNNTEGESSNAAPQKSELTVDEIIEQHVGSFGFSQLLHVFLVSLAWMFDSQNTLVTIFSDAQPQWRCKGSSSSCSVHRSICELEKGSWEWVGGSKSSTIAEWGSSATRSSGRSSRVLVLRSAVHGQLADKYLGRKKTVLLSCLLTAITSFVTSFSPNVWVYAFLRFSNGFARSGIGICCLVLSTETVGRKWRGQVGQYGFFFFTIGFLSLPLIAYPARRSWRNLYKVISILPLAYSLLIIPFISESPRWLAIKGRTDEAMGVLTKLAKLNGKVIPTNIAISNSTTSTRVHSSQRNLWSAKWARKRIVTMMIAGFGIGFVYYGVQLNVENLNFNLYFTVGVNAVMEIPAVFLGKGKVEGELAAAECGGRRFYGGFDGVRRSLHILRGAVRDECEELCGVDAPPGADAGAAIAPLLVVLGRLNPKLSFLIFGVLAVISGSITFWLPETKNAPLYDTLEQQEQQEKEEKLSSAPEREMELVE
uniref:H(+)/Pi cotransporter n=1 Tax=Ananas comosus var. bracteatus TaxID=296719 RepID=A0A6V7QNE0_ANACO|nr:unnamed protein product [Ananas comosus var. bracteatus]